MVRQPAANSQEEIERFLQHGLAPITDDASALVNLGFARAYPNATGGFESSVWVRSVDHGYRQTGQGLGRVMVCQRAFLVSKKSN